MKGLLYNVRVQLTRPAKRRGVYASVLRLEWSLLQVPTVPSVFLWYSTKTFTIRLPLDVKDDCYEYLILGSAIDVSRLRQCPCRHISDTELI